MQTDIYKLSYNFQNLIIFSELYITEEEKCGRRTIKMQRAGRISYKFEGSEGRLAVWGRVFHCPQSFVWFVHQPNSWFGFAYWQRRWYAHIAFLHTRNSWGYRNSFDSHKINNIVRSDGPTGYRKCTSFCLTNFRIWQHIQNSGCIEAPRTHKRKAEKVSMSVLELDWLTIYSLSRTVLGTTLTCLGSLPMQTHDSLQPWNVALNLCYHQISNKYLIVKMLAEMKQLLFRILYIYWQNSATDYWNYMLACQWVHHKCQWHISKF